MTIQLAPYAERTSSDWDDFVRSALNGTFLFERGYMDYHRDRFSDASLVVKDDSAQWLAVLPAHVDGNRLISHGGLTYGGFVVAPKMTLQRMEGAFDALASWMGHRGLKTLTYRPVPFVYAKAPVQEDLYCLARRGATLRRRDILSVVDSRSRLALQERRVRGARKATTRGVTTRRDDSLLKDYWSMLERELQERHQARPVHTLAEMQLLQSRFPQNIKLYVAESGGVLLAGVLIYESNLVARSQYISSTREGRESGALDLLFIFLLDEVYAKKGYFDFGSSMRAAFEIQPGLLDQKEGFGARAVALDTYDLDVTIPSAMLGSTPPSQ